MFRFAKFAALGAVALAGLAVSAPEASAFHFGGKGFRVHFGGGHHHHHHRHFGHHHRHYGGGYYRPRFYAYGPSCVWKRYVNYYGEYVVRRVCY